MIVPRLESSKIIEMLLSGRKSGIRVYGGGAIEYGILHVFQMLVGKDSRL